MAKPSSVEQRSESGSLDWLATSLHRMKIVGAHTTPGIVPLTGGVSSDIYCVELPETSICVKRALPKLKVAADCRVPPECNRNEVECSQVSVAVVAVGVRQLFG